MKNTLSRLRRSNGSTVLAILAVILSAAYSASAAPGSLTWSGLSDRISDGNWDTNQSDLNWLSNGISTFFTQNDAVNFTDAATGSTNITVNGTLTPSAVTVNNSVLAYQLSGTGKISGLASLVKLGSGTLTLRTTNDFTGSTVISAGTLALGNPGNISASVTINIALGATLNAGGTLTLPNGQTLEGGGNITGALTSGAGSIVAPGTTNTMGTLTVSGAISLSGATAMKINGATNDVLASGSSIAYGGTLIVSNFSTNALSVGQTFALFQATSYGGSFATLTLPALGAGLAWNTANLAVDGTLSVASTNAGTEPLTILQQPFSELNQPLGSNVELCITAQSSASTNLQYQWLRNGVIILPTDTNFKGATTPCLLIPAFQAIDSGAFSVEVGDGVTNIVSQPADVTGETYQARAEDAVEFAFSLPSTNQFTVVTSNTNVVKEKGTPDIISNDPGGSEIWFQWSPPANANGLALSGFVTFSTLGSSFDTTMAAYTGSSPSNLTQVPTVINDDDGAGYLNSQISFYAVAGTTYLIAVDGSHGAQGNVVLSWTFYPGSDALPNTTNTPLVIVSSHGATLNLSSPWPGYASDWFLNGQLIATNETNLLITNLSTANLGAYIASYTTPTNHFTVFSEPIQVEINLLEDGTTSTNSVVWPKFLEAADDIFVQPAGTGQVIKLGGNGSAGYSMQQTFCTSVKNNPDEAGEPIPPGGQNGGYPVWYTYTAPATGELEVTTEGSSYPTIIEVFFGKTAPPYTSFSSISPLLPGGSSYYQGGIQPSVYLNVSDNQLISIMVEGVNGAVGSCALTVYTAVPSVSVAMSAAETSGVLTITWPSSGGPYLQYTSTPGVTTSWVDVYQSPNVRPTGSTISLNPPTYKYTTPITGTAMFFRLGSN